MNEKKALTLRERRRDRTKALILQSAADLLAEGGLQNVTLANIADRAAYSKPTLYEYFSGIEDILFELSNTGFIRLGKCVKAVSKSLPPDERLIAAGQAFLKFAAENSELYQLMFSHIIFSQEGQETRWRDTGEETQVAYRVAMEIIEKGIKEGIFTLRPGFDSNMLVYICWVQLHGMASLKHGLMEEMGLDVARGQAEMFKLMVNNLKGEM